jgi:Putative zinc-finger
MNPLTHEQSSELLGPLLRDELDPDAANDVRAHLRECPACKTELEGLRQLVLVPPDAALSPLERARLRAAVMGPVRQARADEKKTPAARSGRPLRWLGAAAVLLVLAVAAGYGGLLNGGGGASGGGSASQQEAAVGGAAGAGAGDFGVRFERHAGQLSAAGLPALAGVRPGQSPPSSRGAPPFDLPKGADARLAPSAPETLLRRLARAAPAGVAGQVTRCGRRVLSRSGPAAPLYGGLGRFAGERALVLGFGTADHPRGRLSGYMFWVFEAGRCDRSLAHVSGALSP